MTIKCDHCGRFIKKKDVAYHNMLQPDSAYTAEEWETCCRNCEWRQVINDSKFTNGSQKD